ncbi:scaffolding protein [Paenibacillus sabinae]|uniref:Scaffold protein n=1 Tax=Paenibacillus sabinae T27 TaxID=1268072 RepID=X4ZR94_9BACL|nr:scaffolding protein [Paenibacillus sabinae]AHV98990.1 scaffold protein [Paenibacillus sabinae T27]
MKNDNERYRYPLNLQLFAEGDPDPDHNPPADPQDPPKTFTQDELDRIVADRIARERKKTEKFADYDDIKAKLSEFEKSEAERQKAEMSATERLEAEKAEALKKAQEAEERGNAALTAANQRLVNAEFKALARDANVPADRLAAALKLADLSEVTVDDEGNPQGVEDAVKALIEANPYLVAETKPKEIGKPSGGADPQDKTKEQLLKEAAEKARKTGRIEDRMAYSALKDELNK